MTILYTRTAEEQIERVARWWEKNRLDAPGAIEDELEKAFRIILKNPNHGLRQTNTRFKNVRRIHLSRIHYYLVYRLIPDGETVEILRFWHTSRKPIPKL